MATYRKNESNKTISQIEDAAASSCVVVNTTDGKQKDIGNPTGAGINAFPRKNGVVGSWSDFPERINPKAGKKRTSDSGQ